MFTIQPFLRSGFCTKCNAESLHVHRAENVIWLGHFLSLNILPRIGVGPWHCGECYPPIFWLSRSKEDRKMKGEVEFEPDGNFVYGESLVRRSIRNSRYTEKFRDSVVERLLAGKVAIAVLRRELKVRESDLLAWISDRVDRQQDEIESLRTLVERLAGSVHREAIAGQFDAPAENSGDSEVLDTTARCK